MRVLVVSSRFPWPSYTGDRMRASIWVAALAPHARVALVAPSGVVPAGFPRFDFYPAARSIKSGLRRAVTVLRDGLPLQSLLAAPYDWKGAMSSARERFGGFDATVVLLSRLDPWVRDSIEGTRILDAIDSLRRNAEERGNAASIWSRWLWRHEARRLAKAEADASSAYEHIVVVSRDETSEFSGAAEVIANSVSIRPLDPAAPRRFDFGFWGRLAYFANADAARWLMDEIWPAIRERHPTATLVIGGADAPRAIRREAERRSIELVSPVADISAFARSVRVAIMPVRHGSGQASKVLEAAEAGCAIVATRQALRALDPIARHASVADDVSSIANAALELLAGEQLRTAMAAALRREVVASYSRDQVLELFAHLAGVRHSAEAVTA